MLQKTVKKSAFRHTQMQPSEKEKDAATKRGVAAALSLNENGKLQHLPLREKKWDFCTFICGEKGVSHPRPNIYLFALSRRVTEAFCINGATLFFLLLLLTCVT